MHDGDELCSELGLYITGDMLDCKCNGVMGHEWRVYYDAEAFYLEVSLVQGFEGASIVKVMVKGHSEVVVSDNSDKSRMFSRRWEKAEVMTVDWDVNGQDRGNLYCSQRRRGSYR